MKRRILSAFLALLMLCSLLPVSVSAAPDVRSSAETVASGTCGKNISWTLDKDGLLAISGYGNMDDYLNDSYVQNPDGGYRIVNTAPWKDYVAAIKKVTFSAGIGNIGKAAFANCTELTEVSFQTTLGDIGAYAFYNCKKLPYIELPGSVTKVQYGSFASCSGLLSVSLPVSVQSIGDAAFETGSELGDVFYTGGEISWAGMQMGAGNDPLTAARRHTYCIDPLTHYTVTEVAATCTDRGYTKHECPCGYIYKDQYTPALGHDFVNGKCSRCGITDGDANPFTDIGTCSQSFQKAILWAYNKGVAAGATKTTYNPNGACTRGQVVTFLWRAAGKPEPTTTVNPYNDVKSGPYYKAILWAAENGITAGYNNPDGSKSFKPNDTVTRGQFVTFLWRYEGKPSVMNGINPFNDVKSGGFYTAILWGNEHGIVMGYNNGNGTMSFKPNNPCTRAHVAVFLYRDLA